MRPARRRLLSGERALPTHGPQAISALAIGAQALGAVALGTVALGAIAIAALAVGRLAVGKARIRRLLIDELVVRRVHVVEQLTLPGSLEPDSPRESRE